MCRKALDIDPTLPKAYFRMGQVWGPSYLHGAGPLVPRCRWE